jgi:hypothetical protein
MPRLRLVERQASKAGQFPPFLLRTNSIRRLPLPVPRRSLAKSTARRQRNPSYHTVARSSVRGPSTFKRLSRFQSVSPPYRQSPVAVEFPKFHIVL